MTLTFNVTVENVCVNPEAAAEWIKEALNRLMAHHSVKDADVMKVTEVTVEED